MAVLRVELSSSRSGRCVVTTVRQSAQAPATGLALRFIVVSARIVPARPWRRKSKLTMSAVNAGHYRTAKFFYSEARGSAWQVTPTGPRAARSRWAPIRPTHCRGPAGHRPRRQKNRLGVSCFTLCPDHCRGIMRTASTSTFCRRQDSPFCGGQCFKLELPMMPRHQNGCGNLLGASTIARRERDRAACRKE